MLLALDTSTQMASIALATEHEVLGEYTWQVGQHHGSAVFPCVQWLFATCGRTMADIDAIAVAIGPGSFNGIRVAVTAAKALAFALNVPVVGICGLDVCAYTQAATGLPVFALQEAGRSELYAAGYRRLSSLDAPEQPPRETWLLMPDNPLALWTRWTDYMIVTPDALAAMVREDTLFCGEMRGVTRATLHRILGERALLVPAALSARRASVLAMLAAQRLRRGQIDDPLTLEPLYLRRPAITVSKKAASEQQFAIGHRPPLGRHAADEAGRAPEADC